MTDEQMFDPKYWRDKGYEAMRRHDLKAGLEALERAHDLDSHDFDIGMALAIALSQAGTTERSLKLFYMLADRRPDEAVVHFNYALALQRVGYKDDAIEQYQAVLKLDPANKEARKRLLALGGTVPRDPLEDFVPDAMLVAEPVVAPPLTAVPIKPPPPAPARPDEVLDALPADEEEDWAR